MGIHLSDDNRFVVNLSVKTFTLGKGVIVLDHGLGRLETV